MSINDLVVANVILFSREGRVNFGIDTLTRTQKRLLLMAADAFVVALALWLSLVLRTGNLWPEERLLSGWWLFATLPLAGVVIFKWQGVYRTLLRAMALDAYVRIVRGVALLSAVLALVPLLMGSSPIPNSTPVIFFFLGVVWVLLVRVLAQACYSWLKLRAENKKPVLVYGAGDTGTRLANALKQGGEYEPVAFIDDDSMLHQSVIHGCPVYPPSEIAGVISSKAVSKVFLAFPSVSITRRQEIVRYLDRYRVEVQTVPTISELIGGFAKVNQLRDLDVHDLLGRAPVEPIHDLAERSIRGKSVAVTGGGGSIGSELCRQILAIGPKRLIVYEMSELALYGISRELNEILSSMGKRIPIYTVLGSVCDKRELTDTLRRHEVQTLYHAAAYKHVPILEDNVMSGIVNNVIGSKVVADSAAECGVERVILISTDKAVRPTNAMGATKRFAEQIFQAEQARHPDTLFSMVRFGNVINSSGSVIPLFQKQIKDFGPVTVTHREITRFFMTIPEAAQLVIQAGSMAEGGDVFLLDMGRPVNIAALARRMIELSGLAVKDEQNPEGDIEIAYTGLRPGEKLHEELLIDEESCRSQHPKIMRACEEGFSPAELDEMLGRLCEAVETKDLVGAIRVLQDAVPEYKPDTPLAELLRIVPPMGADSQNAA